MSEEIMTDVLETPETEQFDDSQIESQESSEQQTDQTEQLDQNEVVDKQPSQSSIRQTLKKLGETNPELAKDLKTVSDAYFREQTYKKVFDTTEEATKAKELIESAGGLEGIADIQDKLAIYNDIDAGLAEGDPQVIDGIFEDFPEGALKLAGPYLEKLWSTNADAFRQTVGPYAIALLADTGIGQYFQALGQETDPTNLAKLGRAVADWYARETRNVNQIAQNMQQKNPAADKLNEERTAIQAEREQIYKNQIGEKYKSATEPDLNREIAKYSRQYNLNTKQAEIYKNMVVDRVFAGMNNDESYKKQLNLRYVNALKDKNFEKVSNYAADEFRRRLRTEALDVVKSLYGNPKVNAVKEDSGITKPNSPKVSPTGGPMKVNVRPPKDQWDMTKTTDIDIIKGQAWLKNGRFVSWKHLR